MARRPSVMTNRFSMIEPPRLPRAVFDRSHGHKTTINSGYLYPIFIDEVMPGDTMRMRMTAFGRLATPIYPLMDNLKMSVFWFECPMRILWTNFVRMMGERDDPSDSISYVMPTMPGVASTGYSALSLYDYLGIPPGIPDLEHNSLPMRMYNLVYNHWFRDQNLQDSVTVDLDDGPDDPADYVLLRRGKRHDYFTSSLPTPQKGDALSLPLGTQAPVDGLASATGLTWNSNPASVIDSAGTTHTTGGDYLNSRAANDSNTLFVENSGSDGPAIFADLSAATAATINQLRESFQLQVLLERDMRGGTRYIELVKSHFGVTSPDFRMQRPEYLGGSVDDVIITPVSQSSETNTTAQGTQAAFGTVGVRGSGFTKSVTEHGYVMGIIQVSADLTYQQGLEKMWSRSTRYDFYWPALANLGEEPVYNREIYAVGSGGSSDGNVWGYNERYSSYRYKPSRISGQLRSTHATPLDAWHLGQEFSSLPVLNASFIVDNPPISRVVADNTDPEFILDMYFDYKCARTMPVYATPLSLGRF